MPNFSRLNWALEFGYYARLGEEIEDGDHRKGELFSWYIGRPRNTWVIGFSDLAYGFLSDSKRTQDIAPNKWNHLCIAISSEARMVRPILVSGSKKLTEIGKKNIRLLYRSYLMQKFELSDSMPCVDTKLVSTNLRLQPSWLVNESLKPGIDSKSLIFSIRYDF